MRCSPRPLNAVRYALTHGLLMAVDGHTAVRGVLLRHWKTHGEIVKAGGEYAARVVSLTVELKEEARTFLWH